MDRKWYHVCWHRLTAKRVEPVVSISWASCCWTIHCCAVTKFWAKSVERCKRGYNRRSVNDWLIGRQIDLLIDWLCSTRKINVHCMSPWSATDTRHSSANHRPAAQEHRQIHQFRHPGQCCWHITSACLCQHYYHRRRRHAKTHFNHYTEWNCTRSLTHRLESGWVWWPYHWPGDLQMQQLQVCCSVGTRSSGYGSQGQRFWLGRVTDQCNRPGVCPTFVVL